jgi:hypothetical protein
LRYIVGVSESGVAFHFPPQSKTSSCGTQLAQKGGCDFYSVAFVRLYSPLFAFIRLFIPPSRGRFRLRTECYGGTSGDFLCMSGSKNYKQCPVMIF